MNRVVRCVYGVVFLLGLPAMAAAQAVITGVVRDTSGAVLPGVTVEAASPALIEKVRTAVTDGSGQYRIIDLRPGTYGVTFTLPGFATVRREAVELSGSATVTVNAEMRVGAVEETITVSADAPVVDVQSVTQQRAIGREVIDAVPTGRTVHNMAALIPGMVIGVTGPVGQDVGGSTVGALQMAAIHGGRTGDQRVMMDGLPLNTSQGNLSGFISNIASTQEFTIDTSGVSAEDNSGGVRMNIVPREGGNQFSGTIFVTGATEAFQSSNFDDDLAARGFEAPDPPKNIDNTFDINPAVGGPIQRDRLWFYSAFNWHRDRTLFSGNPNANPDAFVYTPDPGGTLFGETDIKSINTRLTWQVTPRNKLSFFIDRQDRCLCPEGSATISPEAQVDSEYPGQRFMSLTWSAPVTPRVLIDAAVLNRYERWGDYAPAGANLSRIQVVDDVTGLSYRGIGALQDTKNQNTNLRASLSYVTGAHSFKTGFMGMYASHEPTFTSNLQNQIYTFVNGVPSAVTLLANPRQSDNRITDFGMFVQDRWTIDRLTLSGGLRFDYLHTWFPAQTLGPAPLVPNRSLSIDKTDWVSWTDLTPRMGAALDVFGDGRTGVKVTLNKYLGAQSASGQFGLQGNPLNRLATETEVSWTDANGNFVPDCDLLNPAGSGECGPYSNQGFGQLLPSSTFDPDLLEGYGVRSYNWEFAVTLQQELLPRVSMEVGYFRRWYGNFVVTDNRAVSPADFDTFTLTAPSDPRLPNGGGYTTPTLYAVAPAAFGRTDNFVTLAENYGEQSERWHGVDLSFNVRPSNGLLFQGGLSTGNTVTDNCEVLAALPELTLQGNAAAQANSVHCRVETNFLTQVKGLASYTVPRIDVQVSASFQSIPGPQILGTWQASNALASAALGRPLAGGARTIAVGLVEPGTTYGGRSNQVDLRFGKNLRFGGARANVALDLYNAFNANPVLGQINNFGPVWQRPLFVLPGRLAKISATFDF